MSTELWLICLIVATIAGAFAHTAIKFWPSPVNRRWNKVRKLTCREPAAKGGHSHWFCMLPHIHDGKHRFNEYTWGGKHMDDWVHFDPIPPGAEEYPAVPMDLGPKTPFRHQGTAGDHGPERPAAQPWDSERFDGYRPKHGPMRKEVDE